MVGFVADDCVTTAKAEERTAAVPDDIDRGVAAADNDDADGVRPGVDDAAVDGAAVDGAAVDDAAVDDAAVDDVPERETWVDAELFTFVGAFVELAPGTPNVIGIRTSWDRSDVRV